MRWTYVASAGRTPTTTLGESLDLLAGGLKGVRTALLPDVDAAWTESETLLVGETVDDHREDSERHCVEDDLRVAHGADAEVGDRGCLAGHGGQDGWEGGEARRGGRRGRWGSRWGTGWTGGEEGIYENRERDGRRRHIVRGEASAADRVSEAEVVCGGARRGPSRRTRNHSDRPGEINLESGPHDESAVMLVLPLPKPCMRNLISRLRSCPRVMNPFPRTTLPAICPRNLATVAHMRFTRRWLQL